MPSKMSIRLQTEAIELQILHPHACLSSRSRGRIQPEKEDDIRTCFQRDRDRIIHCKAFRRLKQKTQVFFAPRGDHYRTRLTHVLEVSQIARTIARALRLNEDLTEAISLGHDLGHTPFGHAGEEALNELYPGGFDHYQQSLRVVDVIEKDGKGLNLTHEVRDGILKHSKGKGPIVPDLDAQKAITLEGQIVRIADIIAYLNHDLDDAIRAGLVQRSNAPAEISRFIGKGYAGRINSMVHDVVRTSLRYGLSHITFSHQMEQSVYRLRDYMFSTVYDSPIVRSELTKSKKILRMLYTYYLEHTTEICSNISILHEADKHRLVCDFIAGMTDQFALATYEELFLPKRWKIRSARSTWNI